MFVYLIQPGYCHGTNRYKIGMSTDGTLTRVVRGYPKNSTIFCIAGTFDNPRVVENDLIQCFCNRFQLSECGREYFEGSLREMIALFNAIVDKHRKYEIKKIVEYVDDTSIKCLKCHETYHQGHMARHLQTCQNIPLTTCANCFKVFKSRQGLYQHNKSFCKTNNHSPNVHEHHQEYAIEFESIDDTYVECTLCRKQMTRRSFYGHKKVCKRVPKNTCEYCHMFFRSQQSHSRHRKTCKKRPVQQEEKVENITLDFGKEDLSNLEPRLFESFADAIQFVYFNKDYPENQTVRKRVKRDHSMEVMENNQWKTILCSKGIPIIRERLKECGYEVSEQMTDSDVREVLYNHTRHGESKI